MRHADERPARDVHRREKPFTLDIYDPSLQRLLRRERDRVDDEVEFPPFLSDAIEHGLHFAGRSDFERHQDGRFELARQRLDVFLRLVVEIGHGKLGAECPECLGAAPRDRILVGDADDKAFLALEQLGFHDGNHD